ncbi:MAG: choice-of-anchor Q domain-containing protein [Anaerolineales bacterium]
MRSRYRTLLWPLLAALLPLLAVWLAPPRVRAAGTWYVSANTGDDANDCAAPATPCLTIQAALGKPGFLPGDTVLVAEGNYIDYINLEVVSLTQDVTLSGGWDTTFTSQGDRSIVEGNRGMTIENGVTATIMYLEVVGNYSGGLYNQGALTLDDVRVSGYNSGGLYNGGNLMVRNSLFDWSYYNGIVNDGVLVITNTLITGNYGIGISNSGTLTMYNSTVSDHTGAFVCHGISNAGKMVMIDSTVVRNGESFGFGGGICNYGQMTLINSTVRDNRVFDTTGGGVYNRGSLFLYNTSVVSNNVWHAGTGGGIYGGNVMIQNSLIAENDGGAGPDCNPNIQSLGYSLIKDTSDCSVTSGPGDLLDVASGVFPYKWILTAPLIYTSPAIDAGDPAGCKDMNGNPLSTDQRGVSRVGRCDIGSYEYDPQLDPLLYFRMPWVENQ